MIYVELYLDHPSFKSGTRHFIVVRTGRSYAVLLDTASLRHGSIEAATLRTAVELPTRGVAARLRRTWRRAREQGWPASSGVHKRPTQRLVKRALELLNGSRH